MLSSPPEMPARKRSPASVRASLRVLRWKSCTPRFALSRATFRLTPAGVKPRRRAVNSAGVFATGVVGAPDADLQQFERQIDVNIKGVVTAVRQAAPLLSDNGRIVSIGTTGATRIAFPGMADYVASKAAVAAYTRGWSRDLGARGITVNVVQPGAINTEMNPQDSAFADTLRAMTSLGRYGQPEEIAGAVSFLEGPDTRYITGATPNVDGGQIA